MEDSKFEASITDDRPILVSQEEIEKRRRINFDTLGSFAVDNMVVFKILCHSPKLCKKQGMTPCKTLTLTKP